MAELYLPIVFSQATTCRTKSLLLTEDGRMADSCLDGGFFGLEFDEMISFSEVGYQPTY